MYYGVNGILTQYLIRCDPYLGIEICAIRIIPCSCIDIRNAMDLPWGLSLAPKDQPRYSSVTKYKYYTILGKNSDWVIMNFIDKYTDE